MAPSRASFGGTSQPCCSEMDEEHRDMKAHKVHCEMLHYVADAQQGIPKLCPYGSITKEFVDEKDTYDYTPEKDTLSAKTTRQPWVMDVEQEVERLKLRVHDHEKLLRECATLKAQVSMLLRRVSELERVM
ncbi:unnamed protein product [Eruca vesicaria subsp. sativa]|uniref:Uncharacterized protein n=1 Tax=Eruca vesicaria subsp. sativa TaxID=29727 RepID=A0ABC8LSW6_ERUVS|nr:unnamed protein product [Eruca vesicaria subsp. sativa]